MGKKIRVVLRNRVATFLRPYPADELLRHYSYSFPGARFSKLFNTFIRDVNDKLVLDANKKPQRLWDGRIKLLKRDQVSSGLFRALKKEMKEKHGVKFKVTYRRKTVATKEGLKSDRDYQNRCTRKMLAATQRGGGIVLNATGTGKTYILALYASHIVGKVLFVVNALDLLQQAQKEIQERLGEEVGYVGESIFKAKRVTVATIQTLAAHREDPKFHYWLRDLQVMVLDEVHEMVNKQNKQVVAWIQPLAVFGLTATLQLKKKPVRLQTYELCGPVVFNYPISTSVKEGYTSPGVVLQLALDRPIYKDKRYNEDYDRLVIDDPTKTDLIRRLVQYGYVKGWYMVLLVARRRHLKQLSIILQHIPHATAWGEIAVLNRKAAVDKLELGKIRLIIANQVFKKGINIKRLDFGIDAAEQQSSNDTIQKYGRLTRLHPKKKGFIYIDVGSLRNRFEKATGRRKRAFSAEKIPVKRLVLSIAEAAEITAKEIFTQAQKMLDKELKKHGRS
jgi:superfamily II DNA or RNA helicase